MKNNVDRTIEAIKDLISPNEYSVDNASIIREIFLYKRPKNIESFNIVKAMIRKKDIDKFKDSSIHGDLYSTLVNVLGSKNEKVLFETTISNVTELDNAIELMSLINKSLPVVRLYYVLDIKSVRNTVYTLYNTLGDLIRDTDCNINREETLVNYHRRLFNLSKSACNKKEGSISKSDYLYQLIDFDNLEENNLKKEFYENYIFKLKNYGLNFWEIKTKNGFHVVYNKGDMRELLEGVKNTATKKEIYFELVCDIAASSEICEIKENAMTLIRV